MVCTGVACCGFGQQRKSLKRLRALSFSAKARTSFACVGLPSKATRSRWRANNSAKLLPTMPLPRMHTSKLEAMK